MMAKKSFLLALVWVLSDSCLASLPFPSQTPPPGPTEIDGPSLTPGQVNLLTGCLPTSIRT